MRIRNTIFALLCGLLSVQGCASFVPPESFNSPQEGVNALVDATRNHSSDRLRQILGGASEHVISSGDPVADRNTLDAFVERYDEKHQLSTESDGSVTLVAGRNDWPMPIPLVKDQKTGRWHFDIERGKEEIINRRVGRNEINVVQVCLAVTDAQREYAIRDPQGVGVPVFAQKFRSDPGKKNGLYWNTSPGEPLSPLGELAATASEQGYGRSEGGAPQAFHGYYFRMLTAQGSSANGGVRSYVVSGKMVGGFGVVAYPAEYGNSGVMTFVVNHEGIVYQRDLGKNTARIAKSMTEFDPGVGWEKSDTSLPSGLPGTQ